MASEPLLRVEGLARRRSRGWFGAPQPAEIAIHHIDLTLERGRTLGLAGPSGSGKSTLARCLALFDEADAGQIRLEGRILTGLSPRAKRRLHPEIQLIFQQPAAALNPQFTAAEIVAEPLLIQRQGTARALRRRVRDALESAGIDGSAGGKRALAFSGGERQRLAIARALVLAPKVLILDESLSGLDLSVRAQVINLIIEAQEKLGLACIVVSHDLDMVARWADEIAVMDEGTIVERGSASEVLAAPRHPRTRELVAAARQLDWSAGR
jgi:ABC-type glutathione transport system ATPase component